MSAGLDRLVDSLLYEGYALYPYTPGATKNATPTPFGIVYPPAYAAECDGAFDHARMECLAEPQPGATLTAELRYLTPSGLRHQAQERRIASGPLAIGERETTSFEGGRLTVRSEPADGDRVIVRACVHNTCEVPAGLDRAAALQSSLVSTHLLVTLSGGRFVSPLEAGSTTQSVNTWPVLATPDDTVMLGATIVLPDHPQIAPESRGSLFDATEIEEALVLHVQALSDGERAAISEQDPAVRDMIERAAAVTPEEMLALHGRLTLRDRETNEPPSPSVSLPDPSRGQDEVEVDGVVYRRGGRVVLRPGADSDLHAQLLDGRPATIERIFVDVDDRAYLAVTVDDDPGQALMRETGRFLFFFTPEVEVLAP